VHVCTVAGTPPVSSCGLNVHLALPHSAASFCWWCLPSQMSSSSCFPRFFVGVCKALHPTVQGHSLVVRCTHGWPDPVPSTHAPYRKTCGLACWRVGVGVRVAYVCAGQLVSPFDSLGRIALLCHSVSIILQVWVLRDAAAPAPSCWSAWCPCFGCLCVIKRGPARQSEQQKMACQEGVGREFSMAA
jgi:hypothetical protein